MPSYVTVLISILTFIIGLLAGLFYKYSDLTAMKVKVDKLEKDVNVLSIVELASNVKAMKESLIFSPDFQARFSTVLAEHDRMRNKIEENSTKVIVLEEQIKHAGNQFAVNINKKQE